MTPRDKVTVCGLAAVRALLANRPEDAIRLLLTEERVADLREHLRRLARDRKVYRVVAGEEVERVAESVHHEGVCLLARAVPVLPAARAVDLALAGPDPVRILVLVNLRNPHNVGAVLRAGANFGAAAFLLTGPADVPRLTPAAYRMAEGGAESAPIGRTERFEEAIRILRERGVTVLAADPGEGTDLFAAGMPDRVAFLLGAEAEGLPPDAVRAADAVVRIPGTGRVESLNVAHAAAVLLAEAWRRRPPGR